MQLMPATAAPFFVRNPTSIQDNIGGGVRYLAALNDLFHGDLRLVVAAYYCGEHHILTSGLRYHNAEVIAYVLSVENRCLAPVGAIAQNLGTTPAVGQAVQGQTASQPEGAFLNVVNWIGNVICPVGAGLAVVGTVIQ
jgi:hypothetical protein